MNLREEDATKHQRRDLPTGQRSRAEQQSVYVAVYVVKNMSVGKLMRLRPDPHKSIYLHRWLKFTHHLPCINISVKLSVFQPLDALLWFKVLLHCLQSHLNLAAWHLHWCEHRATLRGGYTTFPTATAHILIPLLCRLTDSLPVKIVRSLISAPGANWGLCEVTVMRGWSPILGLHPLNPQTIQMSLCQHSNHLL